jgi:hypothetical protein
MKRLITTILLVLALGMNMLKAHEGMWIPLFLGQYNEAQMKEMGMKISAEDIYSINKASLKDAIVIFGGGCTGELISGEGLLLTNHHCGYSEIQNHSSIEHDYLTNGFWAMNQAEELPNPGLTVKFLVEMREVTDAILAGVNELATAKQRDSIVNQNLTLLKANNAMDNGIEVVIKPFFNGNRYFMFFYEEFKDVRLVGAPPSNIGKFGGDTDNWMWPRHTGDFSLFRIYANKDNKAAAYSKDNIPYKPKKFLDISLKGVEKEDFTFVYGYPGTTKEYLISDAVELITEVENPIRIKMRTIRLNMMKSAQNADAKVRIQYAKKVAGLANGWKKWQGENKGVDRLDAIENKRIHENELLNWLANNAAMNQKHSGIIDRYRELHASLKPLQIQMTYLMEAGMGIELISFASGFRNLEDLLLQEKPDEAKIADAKKQLIAKTESFFKDYHQPIDEAIALRLLEEYYVGVEKEKLPTCFQVIDKDFHEDFKKFVAFLFQKSVFVNQLAVMEMIQGANKKALKTISKDPASILAKSIRAKYTEIESLRNPINQELKDLDRRYMQMLMDYEPNRLFYPDANFTLRITYGNVDGYYPADGVYYQHFTTLDGIMEKENPEIYDYVVEPKLKKLWQDKDYGVYGGNQEKMNVCFTGSNHTTGGNSGSPVFNAQGQLVGINFDRNWEGTMSDLIYDPDQCRNITLDIRYCLFIIDKYAGATHLIKEMNLIE